MATTSNLNSSAPPIAIPTGGASTAGAGVANALDAGKAATQPDAADDKKDDQDPRLAKKSPYDKEALGKLGFSSLDDVEKLGAKGAQLSEVAQLIMGVGTKALERGADGMPQAGDSNQLIEENFGPVFSRLSAPKEGASVGGAYALTDSPNFQARALPFLPLRQMAEALPGKDTTGEQGESRLRLVRLYQQVGENNQIPEKGADVTSMSPEAQLHLGTAAHHVQAAMAVIRAQNPQLWAPPASTTGKLSAMRVQINSLLSGIDTTGEVGGAEHVADHEIELPSPALVQLEQAGQAFAKAVTAQRTAVTKVGPRSHNGPATAGSKQDAGPAPQTNSSGGASTPTGSTTTGGSFDPSGVTETLNFKSGDIEALSIMVMMNGISVEDDLTRDMLANMDNINKQKEQLHKLQTQAKESEAHMATVEENEFNQLKSEGLVAPTITLDQYKSWRTFSYAGMGETTNPDGSIDYQMPLPQIPNPTPPDAASIPDWIKTGNVAPADGGTAKSDKDLEKLYGIPPDVFVQLKKIFKDSGTTGDMQAWLEGTVGVTQAYNLDDMSANMSMLQSFLGLGPNAAAGPKPAALAGKVDPAMLKKLEDAATHLAEDKLLQQKFPSLVSDEKISAEEAALASLVAGQDGDKTVTVTDATAKAFNTYMNGSPDTPNSLQGKMKKFSDDLNTFVNDIATSDNYSMPGNVHEIKGSSPSSFKTQTTHDSDCGKVTITLGSDGGPKISKSGTADDFSDHSDAFTFTQDYKGNIPDSIVEAFKRAGDGGQHLDTGLGTAPPPPTYVPNSDPMMPGTWQSNGTVADAWKPYTGAGDVAGITDGLKAEYNMVALDASAGPSPDDVYTAKLDALTQDFTSANSALGTDGSPTTAGSKWQTWAQKNGLDPDYNAAQEAAGLKPPAPPQAAQVDEATGMLLDQSGTLDEFTAKMQEISDKLDTLSSITDTEQLRLQAQMERRSKLLETLSNILKDFGNTDKTIRDNIK